MVVTVVLRVLQLVFAAVVLALSVVLINEHGTGKSPTQLPYGAFCGGLGLFVGAIGLAAVFFDKLQGIIMAAVDALATLFVLAGGITYAVSARVGSCSNARYIANSNYRVKPIFSTGLKPEYFDKDQNLRQGRLGDDLWSRCLMVQVETAFLWFLFACLAATAVLGLMTRSKSRGASFV
ncbi:hypothetical protein PVAG01_02503 [Phlyctema vagabunda]|uniref:MARVEL domain-containing protein n=1 Tax=Phlyctema vagabunda TaxID=108571 RepID=A0ABR4PQS4_9HELO